MALILAIDDDKNTLKLLETQLAAAGHQVISAMSGKEGIELARTGNPDLILLDILMPAMTGYEVIKYLKKDELTKSTPVIMLTAKSNREDVITSLKQGAVDYMIKPHNIQILTKKIESALRIGKLHRLEEAAERSEHIGISRGAGNTVIVFKTGFKNKQVAAEAKTVFNPVFFKLTKNDTIIFDLRSLPDMEDDDVAIFKGITEMFEQKEINIVAGRHYGTLVSSVDFDEQVRLHISYGDLEVYLSGKK